MPTTTTDHDVMPHPKLTPIFGTPNQRTVTLLRAELLANSKSVPSDGGDGILGHARLVLVAAEYSANSQGHVGYIAPVKPAPVVHLHNASAAAMYRNDAAYKSAFAAWKLHHDTEATLLQQLIAAVDDTFTQALHDELWGYVNTTTLALLTHLHSTYSKITAEDMQANRVQLTHQWTPPDDVENFFPNINNCIKFSAAGGDPISEVNAV